METPWGMGVAAPLFDRVYSYLRSLANMAKNESYEKISKKIKTDSSDAKKETNETPSKGVGNTDNTECLLYRLS